MPLLPSMMSSLPLRSTYVAVGLKRVSGFMLFDLTRPNQPVYNGFFTGRNMDVPTNASIAEAGDLAPEVVR